MRDFLTSNEFEFLSIEVNGEQLPPFPVAIYFPSPENPYFIFVYPEGKNVIATGNIKICYEPKKESHNER